MCIRRILIAVIAMHLLAHQAFADIIMLRDGVKFVGSVVNREGVRSSPDSYEWIGFIPDNSQVEMRFPASDVEYILFQDGADHQLVEFTHEPTPYEAGPTATVMGSVDSKGRLAWIIAAGLIIAGVGVLIKLGNERQMIRSGSLSSSSAGHNAADYAWIGIGSAIVAGGIAKGLSRSGRAHDSGDGLVLGCRSDQGQRSLALAYRVDF